MKNNSLESAKLLELPTREAVFNRDISVSQFWNTNGKLLEEAWLEWELENKEKLPTLDESIFDPKLRTAIKDAWENPENEHKVADLWEEIIPGVYQAQFFDIEKLNEIRDYFDKISQSQIPARAPYGIQLNRYGLMLDKRSEGYLATPSFQSFYNLLLDRYMRPISRLLLDTFGYDNQTFGFSIQYNPDKDKDLKPHTDASAATLNINMNLEDEKFKGSQVDFYDKNTGKPVQTIFEPGKAIIHRGNVAHVTHPITEGQRSNLVMWLYGERMQIPRSGANSYGNFDDSNTKTNARQNATAQERWRIPNVSKDSFAPF